MTSSPETAGLGLALVGRVTASDIWSVRLGLPMIARAPSARAGRE